MNRAVEINLDTLASAEPMHCPSSSQLPVYLRLPVFFHSHVTIHYTEMT